jgi:hypothetical protein
MPIFFIIIKKITPNSNIINVISIIHDNDDYLQSTLVSVPQLQFIIILQVLNFHYYLTMTS